MIEGIALWLAKLGPRFHRAFIEGNRWRLYLKGLGATVEMTALALCMGIALGVVVAVIRTAHDQQRPGRHNLLLGLLNVVCKIYTTILRGTPMMVQLLIWAFVIFKTSRNMIAVGIIGLGINSGAYVAEIVRGGLMSVDVGQSEAGRSLGLNYFDTMRFIVIPQAFKNILPSLGNEFITLFKDTSLAQAIGGAASGIVLKQTIIWGLRRSAFSNEAGLGSAPIAAAAASTNSCVRQGLVSMTGVFIDTIIICTMTGLTIIISGAWFQEGLKGVAVTSYAFAQGMSFAPFIGQLCVTLSLMFFAFTTILGWDYYAERCVEYLTNGNMAIVKIYRYFWILAVLVGPFLALNTVWTLADALNGLMAFPNLVALVALSGVVAAESKHFFSRWHE